jgi:hypothetical protein
MYGQMILDKNAKTIPWGKHIFSIKKKRKENVIYSY